MRDELPVTPAPKIGLRSKGRQKGVRLERTTKGTPKKQKDVFKKEQRSENRLTNSALKTIKITKGKEDAKRVQRK